VGPRVVASLVEGGCGVRTISLDPPPVAPSAAEKSSDKTQIARYNGSPGAVSAQPDGGKSDAVIHLARCYMVVNPPPSLAALSTQRINVAAPDL